MFSSSVIFFNVMGVLFVGMRMSHSCLLLVAGTGSALFRAGLVEFPCEIEREGATGGIMDCQVTITENDGIGLVGVEDVDAAQVGSQ